MSARVKDSLRLTASLERLWADDRFGPTPATTGTSKAAPPTPNASTPNTSAANHCPQGRHRQPLPPPTPTSHRSEEPPVNKPKAKGTAAETALLRWLRTNGFPWAERLALAGAADCGDISLLPGRAVVLEVKAHATAGRGIPQDGDLTEWMAQAATECDNAGADMCPLILRRAGKGAGDPGKWWAWLTFADVTTLTGAPIRVAAPLAPICMSVASLTALLRAAGYGEPLTEIEVAS